MNPKKIRVIRKAVAFSGEPMKRSVLASSMGTAGKPNKGIIPHKAKQKKSK